MLENFYAKRKFFNESTKVQNARRKFGIIIKTVLILLMVNNAEIVQCESHKSRWNSENDVLGCSCSDYSLMCVSCYSLKQ